MFTTITIYLQMNWRYDKINIELQLQFPILHPKQLYTL